MDGTNWMTKKKTGYAILPEPRKSRRHDGVPENVHRKTGKLAIIFPEFQSVCKYFLELNQGKINRIGRRIQSVFEYALKGQSVPDDLA